MRELLGDLLDLLLPPACAGCRREPRLGAPLCPACDARLPRLPAERCLACQEADARADGRCARCAAAAGPLRACVAAAWFEGDAARFVRRFKYARRGLTGLDPGAEAVAGALACEAAARLPGPLPDAVVPIPVHPRRLRARGFHPAGILARTVARARAAPLAGDALRCTRDAPSQTALPPERRRRNVAGVFACRRPPGARIWLVDDVVTTGATLGEAARALADAGADEVLALCVARTPRVEGPGANG